MKKIILALLSGCWLLACGPAYSQNIAVVSSREVNSFADTVNGIKNTIGKNTTGMVIDIIYTEDGDYLAQLKTKKYDVICPLGISATKKVAAEFKDIPIVFSLIIDPVQANVVPSMGPSGSNICGISLATDAKEQVGIVKKIIPGLKKVGLLYEGASQSFYDALNSIESLKVEAKKVFNPSKVPSVMSYFTSDNIDIFWLVLDSDIYNKDSLAYVLNYMVANKIPTMVFSSNMVKAGALMGFTYDYTDLGVQTGEMILGVLKGKLPAEIPVATPRKLGYALNVKIAGYIGMNIPRDAIDAAAEVYK
jgi:putative ABC transport system substrate-binding protein